MEPSKAFAHELIHGREDEMLSQDQWSEIRLMAKSGKSIKKISRELGISKNTVRRVLRATERKSYSRTSKKPRVLDEFLPFVQARAPEVNFNATILFREIKDRGYTGGYTTVRQAVKPLRDNFVKAEAASVRFETPPGHQAQVDWGTSWVMIGGQRLRLHIFVIVLCYSRSIYVEFTTDEKLSTLINCHEKAFRWFGGLTEEILYDNPRTIVLDRGTEKARINPLFQDFCGYYGFRPRLCRPYRARTKGKVESGVKYVKRSFLPGRSFSSIDHANEQVQQWIRHVADQRIHGTVHEQPAERFHRENLRPLGIRDTYRLQTCQVRKVASDCLVSYEANRYSVPWRYTRQFVDVQELNGFVQIYYRGKLIAEHQKVERKHQMVINPDHYSGLLKQPVPIKTPTVFDHASPDVQVRSLAIYEAIAGGEFHG